MEQEINNKQIRCPRLGDEIPFFYCLQEAVDFPCARIIFCWMPFFDIENYLKDKLAPQKWEKFINLQPKDKIVSLVQIIEGVKARK
jgi:hypothetical protein